MSSLATVSELEFSVSDALSLINQTLEFAYPSLTIIGELSNYRISKDKWLYFDLKDEGGIIKFFGTVYNLPGPLENGIILKVRATPRLHPQYGFSFTVQKIVPAGEGSLKKAQDLLKAKLTREGLLDPTRKRLLPYPPETVALVTSLGSAAHADFMKITTERWPLLELQMYSVHVQGEQAVMDIVEAVKSLNEQANPPDVIVVTRGGGSSEDLAAFNNETLVRVVAASRVPTLLAIGHESDFSLAELVADVRASTPSNAAELLVPDKKDVLVELSAIKRTLIYQLQANLSSAYDSLQDIRLDLKARVANVIEREFVYLRQKRVLVKLYDPRLILMRGYALVRSGLKAVRSVKNVKVGDLVNIEISDGRLGVEVRGITKL